MQSQIEEIIRKHFPKGRSRFGPSPAQKCAQCLLRIGWGVKLVGRKLRKNFCLVQKWRIKYGIAPSSRRVPNDCYSAGQIAPRKQADDPFAELRFKQIKEEISYENRCDKKIETDLCRQWARNKYFRESPMARLRASLRLRMRKVLKGRLKHGSTLDLLGCSQKFLVRHIMSQCKRGWTMNNYGIVWVIDHIEPLAAFDLNTLDGQRSAFHYSNLRPLGRKENASKSDSRVNHQPELTLKIF